MKTEKKKQMGFGNKKERGYTLLEYCAGAAVIAGGVWLAMNTLGTNLGNFLTELGNWTAERTGQIETTASSN